MPGLKIEKWYFDCVTPARGVFIGYAAKVRFGPLTLNYGATLFRERQGGLKQEQTFSFGQVTETGTHLEWEHKALGVKGRWRGKDGAAETVLFSGAAGKVCWQCLKPNAEVRLLLSGQTLEGQGYAERLSMTLPPWKLPFNELRWGRFIGENREHYVVWIDWKGSLCKNWIWAAPGCCPGTVADEIICFGKQKLFLRQTEPIRTGKVADSLFGKAAFLAKLLPKPLSLMDEKKYISAGDILGPEGLSIPGISIHEVVTWK